MESQLRVRAVDLGLREAEVSEWEGAIDDDLVAAVLRGLIAFEDALAELTS